MEYTATPLQSHWTGLQAQNSKIFLSYPEKPLFLRNPRPVTRNPEIQGILSFPGGVRTLGIAIDQVDKVLSF